jgi:hypothetical protein
MKEYPAGLTVVHQVMALQICQLRERFVADWADEKNYFTRLAGMTWMRGKTGSLPHKGAFARVCLGVFPHAALARKMLSTQFALVLAFGQVLRLVGYHLLIGIEALRKGWEMKVKIMCRDWVVCGGGVSFSHEVEGWIEKKKVQHVHKS